MIVSIGLQKIVDMLTPEPYVFDQEELETIAEKADLTLAEDRLEAPFEEDLGHRIYMCKIFLPLSIQWTLESVCGNEIVYKPHLAYPEDEGYRQDVREIVNRIKMHIMLSKQTRVMDEEALILRHPHWLPEDLELPDFYCLPSEVSELVETYVSQVMQRIA